MKLSRMCKANCAAISPRRLLQMGIITILVLILYDILALTQAVAALVCGINTFTHMTHPNSDTDAKRRALQDRGTFNPRSAEVGNALFARSDFFDPRDLV